MSKTKELIIIAALGANHPGILAGISRIAGEANVNVEDVSQKIMQGFFILMMGTDFSGANCTFEEFRARLEKAAVEMKIKIFIQHEDVLKNLHTQ